MAIVEHVSRHLCSPFGGLGEEDGEVGSYLMMSLVLGILVVPIVVFGQRPESDIQAVDIVSGINISVRILAAVTAIYALVSIGHNARTWISERSSNIIVKTKLVFLWIFGFAKIIFTLIYGSFYLKCSNLISFELTDVLAIEHITSIIFVILQLVFFQYVGRYTFTARPIIKYVASIIAMANFVDLLVFMTFSVNGNKDIIFDENNTATVNCTGYSQTTVNNLIFITESFRPPVDLQYSALAITLALSMKPDTEKLFSRWNMLGLQFFWRSPKRLAKVITVVVLMNVPLLICVPFNVYLQTRTQSRIWLSLMLAQKIAVFGCLLSTNYFMFKKLKLSVKNISINANEFMLLFSAMGVSAYVSIQMFLQEEVDGVLTSLIIISVFSILYQVTIILFGRRVDLVGNEISTIHAIQQLVVILGCNNMAVWFNDFLYGIWDMSNDRILKETVFKYIALMLYPLLAYYRFQSAMEFMELFRHVS